MIRLLSAQTVYDQLGLQDAPLIIDMRAPESMQRLPRFIPGALHFAGPEPSKWIQNIPIHRPITLYSWREHELASTANALTARGARVSIIEGGIEQWLGERLPTVRVRTELGVPGHSQWVTRERPKIDRLACPWLVRRFIDPQATFFYVPATRVRTEAHALSAQPYDISDVTFSHRGANCSFDAFLEEFDLRDPILDDVAKIVRAADTDTLDSAREAPGLLAISLGLSASISDDQLLLEQAMTIYDALYAWRKTAPNESHSWPQRATQQG